MPSVLDYVFTDDGDLIDEVSHLAPSGNSDHLYLSWFVPLKMITVDSSQEKFSFWKGKILAEDKMHLLEVDHVSRICWSALKAG